MKIQNELFQKKPNKERGVWGGFEDMEFSVRGIEKIECGNSRGH